MRGLVSFAIAALFLSGAIAPNHAAAADDDIIVRGSKEAARKAAKAFVAQVSVRADNQLARYHSPVCPLIIGMPEPYAGMVASRIRDDAVAAGAQIARKQRCDANLIVIFAGDGAALVKDIRNNRPGWLEGLDGRDIDKLIQPGPVRAWSVTTLRNETGQPLSIPPEGTGNVNDPLSGKPVLLTLSASLLHEATRRDLEASFVVIDETATYGLTLKQIADYAAMRGLARTRAPEPGGALTTILGLFDSAAEARPPELTLADTSYLKSLYADKGLDRVLQERNRIAGDIAKHAKEAAEK